MTAVEAGLVDSVPILMYHHVSPFVFPGLERYTVDPAEFAKQMRWLRAAGNESITFDDLMGYREGEGNLPSKPVLITFDDGFQDCMDHAVPVLEREGLTAVFFLVAGLVGSSSSWQVPARGRGFPLMSWEAVRTLQHGGFRFGSHTVSHPRLARISHAACRDELLRSRHILEERLERDVVDLAYPFGNLDKRVRELAWEAGYRTGCTVRVGLSHPRDDQLALPRVPVRGSDSLRDFIARLQGREGVAETVQQSSLRTLGQDG